MNKFPLDTAGVQELTSNIINHNTAQNDLIDQLCVSLREAMTYVPEEDEVNLWYAQAEEVLKNINARRIDFDNLRFGQKNGGHKAGAISPYDVSPGDLSTAFPESPSDSETPMSEEELALYFNEPLPKKPKKTDVKPLNKMTLEEIEEWEKTQDNSNDIYKIAARVKNLARSDGQAALMPAGEALCNVYTHVLKTFYDFADTLDKETKIKLYQLIQKNENMPGNLIAAGVGTKGTKK